jgi:hypothetical protein
MDAKRRRSSALEEITPALAKLLMQSFNASDPAIYAAWRRWHARRRPADFEFLFERYAPLAFITVRYLSRRYPVSFAKDHAEIIQDGLLSLKKFIRAIRPLSFGSYAPVCFTAIKRGFAVAVADHRPKCGSCPSWNRRSLTVPLNSRPPVPPIPPNR